MNRAIAAVLVVGLAACASPRKDTEASSAVAGTPSAPVAPAAPVYAVPGPSKGEVPAPPPHRPSTFWTDPEMALLDQGLEVLNCTRADMGFQKRPIEDPFRLAVVNRALDDPLTVGEEAQAWDEVVKGGNPLHLERRAASTLTAIGWSGDEYMSQMGDSPTGCPEVDAHLPEAVRRRLCELLGAAKIGWMNVGDGLAPLGTNRDPFLRKSLLSQVEKPSWTIDAADLKDEEFLKLHQDLRWNRLAIAGDPCVGATAALVHALSQVMPKEWADFRGRISSKTDIGSVVLYGIGDDVHDEKADEDAVLVIDLGGNDTWTRGASASVLKNRPVSICIDLAGNDRYVGREDLSFGGALGGVAIQWDCAGDDFYDGGHCSLGAGICGVGILVDEGGDDVYRAKDFCIGAGAFGIGILLDKSGNDLYHGDLFAEGFASTRGCGVLADLDGNDVYDAGSVHLHAPLYNDRYQSLSQGFSIGMRPDASGGVGVLVDVKGNDRYTADIYGQGASYWYALGILVDDDGNDTYNLGQYGQGSGIHLSAGILLDRAGSDLYYLKNGVGMGGAHDYSVGMLVDRGGDDYYAGSGGTQGGALTNSVALLFDMGGNDGYAAVNEGAQGYASPARGTGGIGLLMDAGGKDVYTERDRDGAAWTKELLGAGIDEPESAVAAGSGDPGTTSMTPEKAREAVDKDGTVPGPDGKPVDDLEKLWKLSIQWEVGDNRIIVPIARERLWALGKPAIERALLNVGTKDGLEFRAVETTVAKFPAEEVVPRLMEKTKDPAIQVRKGAVTLLAGLKASSCVDRLVELLKTDADLRGTVMAALGAMKVAPPEVAGFLKAPKEGQAVQAVLCLASVGDAAAVAAICGALGPDHAFPVRLAAADRLAGLGSVEALARVSADDTLSTMARRNAIHALGRTKSAEAAGPLAAVLRSPDRLLRMSAFQAAGDLSKALGDGGKDLAAALAAARELEQDPLVKRMR